MSWLYALWRWFLTNKLAQGIVAAIAAFGVYKAHVWREKQEAVKREREQARIEAYEKRAEHEGDVNEAIKELKDEQQDRREKERDENPRDRFNRSPWD